MKNVCIKNYLITEVFFISIQEFRINEEIQNGKRKLKYMVLIIFTFDLLELNETWVKSEVEMTKTQDI